MDQFTEKVSILCQELGLTVPDKNSKGEYAITVDALHFKLFTIKQGQEHLILVGCLGTLTQWCENQPTADPGQVLGYLMRLHAARVKRQGLMHIMTLDEDELVLWHSLPYDVRVPEFLAEAESMLNEVEFWQQQLSAATA